MADVNDLLVRIDATTETLRRELKRAEQGTEQTTKRMDRSLQRVDKGFDRVNKAAEGTRRAIGAVISALAIRRVQQYVTETVSLADAIDKSAKVASVGTEQIQELRFAMGQLAGTTDRDVDLSLQRFNRRLGLARDGSAEYLKTFEALDVQLNQNTSQALEHTNRRLALVRDDADRAAMASKIFGEEAGPKLAAALDGGIEKVDSLRSSFRDGGGLIGAETIERAAELTDLMDKVNRQFTAERTTEILAYKDEVALLAEAFAGLQTKGIGAIGALARFGAGIGEALAGEGNFGAFARGAQVSDVRERLVRARADLERAEANGGSVGGGRSRRSAADLRRTVAALESELATLEGRQEQTLSRLNRPDSPTLADVPSSETFIPRKRDIPEIKLEKVPTTTRDEVQRFFESTRTEAEQLEAQIARVQELADRGLFASAGVDDAEVLDRLRDKLNNLDNETEDLGNKIRDSLALTVGGAIEEMFARGEISAGNFAEAVLRDIARIMAQLLIVKPLIESLFGDSGSGGLLGGFVKSFAGNFFPGAEGDSLSMIDTAALPQKIQGFANGTNSAPGGLAMVGERGPELVGLPKGSRVIPNHELKGVGGGQVVNIIDQRQAGAPPVQTERRSNNGVEEIRVFIRDEVKTAIAEGGMDTTLQSTGMIGRRRGAR